MIILWKAPKGFKNRKAGRMIFLPIFAIMHREPRMQTTTRLALNLLRLAGIVQIVLGLLFWTGNAIGLIQIHMTVGFVLVITLWVLALLGLAAREDVPMGLVILAIIWGAIVPVLGLNQARLLPGDFHWVIKVVHLLVGLIAIGLGEEIAKRILAHGARARLLSECFNA